MAEPQHDEGRVYDKNDEKPVVRPDLDPFNNVPKSPSAGRVSQRDENGTRNPASLQNNEKKGSGNAGTEAGADEANQLNDQVGNGFVSGGGSNSGGSGVLNTTPAAFMKAKLWGNKKKKAATGGIIAMIVAAVFAWSSSVMPTKVLAITTALQNKFFSSAKEATGDMGDNMFRHYLTKHVMPGMVKNNCTSTRVTKSCASVDDTSNPVSALYRAWRDGNIEGKLYEKHGIEIRKEGNQFFLHTPEIKGRIELGTYNDANTRGFEDKAFAALNRSDVRRELRIAMNGATLRERVMFRYSVGALLERKYGIRRCILTCKVTDKVSDKVDVKKNAFRNYFTERVLLPRTDSLGLVVACATNGFDCTDFGDADENGERTSDFERTVRAKLLEHQAKFGQSSLEDLNKQSEDIRNKGFVQFTTEKILGETVGKVASKGIPVLGWIDLGANVMSGAQNMGPAMLKMAYVVNVNSMVQLYSMYRTTADEGKTQKADQVEFGSVTSSLGARKGADQGGISAEQHPYYSETLGSKSMKTASLLPSASAATRPPCDDGQPMAAGEVLCPEETVGNINGAASSVGQAISDMASGPMLAGAGFLAGFWKDTAGQIYQAAQGVIGDAVGLLIPGFVKDKVTEIATSVIETLTTWIIKPALKLTSSGGRLFAMMAGGADAAGNDYAHYGLGAKKIDATAAAEIRERQAQRDQEEFSRQSLATRLFDSESPYSVSSKVALAMPSNFTDIGQQSQQLIKDPMRSIASIFSSFLGSGPNAKAEPGVSPTGIDQYGYDPNDVAFRQDPEKTWKDNDCDNPDNKKNWGNKATTDGSTMPVNHETNPCMLIEQSVASNGGRFNTELIPDYETITNSGTTGETGSTSGDSGSLVSGEAKELAKQILSSGKVTGDSRYMGQIQAVADGNATCHVNPTILQVIATIAETHQIYISSLNRKCTGVITASGTESYHYRESGGHAVDIAIVDGVASNGGTENDLKMLREILPKLPKGSGIGQVQCRPSNALTIPDGISNFTDTCNHNHIQVPVK